MPLQIRIKKNPPDQSVAMAKDCGVEDYPERCSKISTYNLDRTFNTNSKAYGSRDYMPSEHKNATFPFNFFYALSVGKKEAAQLLVDCVNMNVGIKKTIPEDNVSFFIGFFFVLGQKLGDEACAKVLDGETIDDPRVEPCATACARLIRKNVEELGTTYYMKDVIGRAIRLDGEIQKQAGESFFKWTIHNSCEYLVAMAYEVVDKDNGKIYSLPNEVITSINGVDVPEAPPEIPEVAATGCTCDIM